MLNGIQTFQYIFLWLGKIKSLPLGYIGLLSKRNPKSNSMQLELSWWILSPLTIISTRPFLDDMFNFQIKNF